MHLLIFVLVGSVAATNIIEGSGEESSIKHAAISPDMEINGSGYGNDDEDGDALHGSGVSIVEVEGSGFSPSSVKQQPQVTTTATTTRIPPNHLHSESEQTQVFNPVVPIYQLPKDIITTVTATVTTPTRRVAIIPATTADPIATQSPFHPVLKPGIFAAVVGGTVVGLLTAILLVMFVVYRMRKKDEGSYALEEPKPRPYASYAYTKASTKEFYA